MSTQPPPAVLNIQVLTQGVDLIRTIDRQTYGRGTDLLPGGTVGAHFRHCLDFYLCFLSGLEAGRIDYVGRSRDPEVEADPARAAVDLKGVLGSLEAFDHDLAREIEVRGEGEAGWSRSTVGRELQFLLSHTIHHYALIAAVMRAQGCAIDPRFGVAPSTLRHWETRGATA